MGFSSLANVLTYQDEKRLTKIRVDNMMYVAMQDYCAGRFEKALEKYRAVLRTEPGNIEALKRIAYTYVSLGDIRKSSETWKRISRIAPNDKETMERLKGLSYENIRQK